MAVGGTFAYLPVSGHSPVGMKGSAEVPGVQNKPSCCFEGRGCITNPAGSFERSSRDCKQHSIAQLASLALPQRTFLPSDKEK